MLKPGTVVNIYQEPITGTRFEGKARLRERYRDDKEDNLSLWWVEFVDEPGQQYLRTVNTANAFDKPS